MATAIMQSTEAKFLKETIDEIMTDTTDGLEDGLIMRKVFNERKSTDAFVDDVEWGAGGLLAEKPEGGEMTTLTAAAGFTKRYTFRTFGAKMVITREAMEDCKYEQIINLKLFLKRSAFKTVEYSAALVFMRGFNTAFPGGDGVPLFSNAHPLPGGGTFSNLMATPLSPSRTALVVAATQMQLFPGHDGLIEGVTAMKSTFPYAQWGLWSEITKSKLTPEPNNYAEINVVNSDMDITPIPNKYWQNTTTNWALLTDQANGLNWIWRRKPESNSWVGNDNMVMNDAITYRADYGWSDARGAYGSSI